MNKEFYKLNREKLEKELEGNYILVLHSGNIFQESNDQDYPFSVNRNFYYLTGINQDNVLLVIVKGNKGLKEYLFLEENCEFNIKWFGAKLYPQEAREISGIENVQYLDQFDNFIFNAINPSRKNYDEINTVYLDLERRKDLPYKSWAFKFSNGFKKDYPEIKVSNVYAKIIKLRSVKTKEEIEMIQSSIDTTKVALENVMNNIKPGMYEYQAETYFDSAIKWDGQKPVSFATIAASGKNATCLHYHTNNSVIQDGDLVLFDLGCHTGHYISDISRTYPANGHFTKRQREIYEIVLKCNKECIKFLKPGVTWKEYNAFANAILIDGLKKLGLIKKDEELEKYYWHSVGHSIGLDTHDPSLENMAFQEGMLTTCEPGLYLVEEGIGVRIEDDVLITKDGAINLSANIIKEIDDIEKFMNK